MPTTRPRISQILCFLSLFGALTTSANAANIHDAALRKRLATTYAPAIHMDRDEPFGLASIAFFLRRSVLRAVIHRCPLLPKGFPSVNLAPGTLLGVSSHTGTLNWQFNGKLCPRRFFLHATKDPYRRKKHLAAPNRVYLKLRDHKPTTLLKGKHRLAITPALSYHAYESQTISCQKRSIIGFCQQYKTHRYYVIQYFVPLMFNEACNEHEGEHEGLVVLINATAFDRAKTRVEHFSAIQRVGLYGHYHTKLVPLKKLAFVDMTHPVVYMGRGGHALYSKAGSANLLLSFPREIRGAMSRTCRKRGRFKRLTEHHRGGGLAYKTWLPPQGALDPAYQAATYLPKTTPQDRVYAKQQKAFSAACILARKKRGVRLCDVWQNPHNDPCCLRAKERLVPWVRFTGRWGQQEKFASTLAGAAAARVGRFVKRWPLASSMGNSGPFGPQWIHASTWQWLRPSLPPAATSPLWR